MLNRVVAAAFAAAFAFGAGIAPVETAARGGGGGIGGGAFFHPGGHGFSHIGLPRVHPTGPTFVHPGFARERHVGPFGRHRFAHVDHRLRHFGFRRHEFVRDGVPITVWSGSGFYDSPYTFPTDDVVSTGTLPDDPPAAGAAPPTGADIAVVRGCHTQDVTVPAETGGQATVRVTRC
jgi:hypothetical protein